MNPLSTRLDEYLSLRRRLGFKMCQAGYLLPQFVRFAQQEKAAFITTKLALAWATQDKDRQPAYWAYRLGLVRRFARYLSAVDSRTEIPPEGLLPHRLHRKSPYLYRDEEVGQLLQAAQQLPGPDELRAATYTTFFGLLAVTGMRVGEAIGLARPDVNLNQGLLTLRRTKFDKSRLVPIHPTAVDKLRQYEQLRDRICPPPKSPNFFLSARGTRLAYTTVRHWFIQVSYRIGLRGPTDRRGPRLHDLRYRFAMGTLLRWYRTDRDIEAHLPELTTYLGHGHVADTYWYLSATPELLQLATQRWERELRKP